MGTFLPYIMNRIIPQTDIFDMIFLQEIPDSTQMMDDNSAISVSDKADTFDNREEISSEIHEEKNLILKILCSYSF